MTLHEHEMIRSIVEALILASPEPLPVSKIVQATDGLTAARVSTIVNELNDRYTSGHSSFRIRLIAGGYQFYILSDYVGYVEELFARRRKMRLTRAALETIAIIAYKQPITKGEIEQIRGVASDGVLQTLLEKQMVTITGRATTVGKPLQYGTGDEFLKFFGLASLNDLPRMSEIEELIAAREQAAQTELRLPDTVSELAKAAKLNIADGTFDPSSRETILDDSLTNPVDAVSLTLRRHAESESAELELADETMEETQTTELKEDRLASKSS